MAQYVIRRRRRNSGAHFAACMQSAGQIVFSFAKIIFCVALLLISTSTAFAIEPELATAAATPATAAATEPASAASPASGTESELFFERDVRPILKAHCNACHGEEPEPKGGLDLRLVRLIQAGGVSGPALDTASPDDSLLLERVVSGEMPPDSKPPLSAAQIDILKRWITAGAKTRHPEPESPEQISPITDEDRLFWSFLPLNKPAIPTVPASPALGNTETPNGTQGNTVANQQPIDAFIRKRLADETLSLAPKADPRTLIRRASVVLTGLPPDAATVDAFTADSSPANYAAQIDRMMASPQFGERWARFWLDLVRYTDQTPEYLNSAEHGWRYRDWVIAAFNNDLPYDRFLRLQLAADQLEDATLEDQVALGMLGLSPTYWKELLLPPDIIKTIVADEWDERVDTVTRTALGLTVSCARCHHHKFDPVTHDDYYALAGIFANTQLATRPLLPDAQASVLMVAFDKMAALKKQQEELTKNNDMTAAATVTQQMTVIKTATPFWDAPWAHMVEDGRLDVLPDGEHATKLNVRKGVIEDLPLFKRGNPNDTGDTVHRRFLQVLSNHDTAAFRTGSGRRDFVECCFREAKSLSARVMVNRLWGQVFNIPIVKTTSDFGRQGDRPSHPELLEYLAARFVDEGWSMKRLIREMILSETFQQSGHVSDETMLHDPAGTLFSRMPRRKLDVEALRDGWLAVTNQLDRQTAGLGGIVDDPAFRRRTIYGKIVREELSSMLRLYDFPEPMSHSPNREITTTPLQLLYVLNGPLLPSLAEHYVTTKFGAQPAETIYSREFVIAGIRGCYRDFLQREPTAGEIEAGLVFLLPGPIDGATTVTTTTVATATAPAATTQWKHYVHVLLSLNEMQYLD